MISEFNFFACVSSENWMISYDYAGRLMTSFNNVMIQTRGNWFQANPLEHEWNDRAVLLCAFYQRYRYGSKVANLINICDCIVVP